MTYLIFVVYDQKAEAYMAPFHLRTVGEAQRGFGDAINNPETPFGQHPQDYTLFQIGTYSDIKGQITPEAPLLIGNGVEYLTNQTPAAGANLNGPSQQISNETSVQRGAEG